MEDFEHMENIDENNKRPRFLLVLCILTISNSGLTLIQGLLSLVSGKPSESEIIAANVQISKSIDLLKEQKMDYWIDVIKKVQIMTEGMYQNFTAYISASILIAICGLASAILMLIGKKIGFHAYIIYCFLWVLQSYLFVAPQNVPSVLVLFNVLFCIGFILMYSRNLKWLAENLEYKE